MVLNERSETRLQGINADLARVVRSAAEITAVDFIVTEGLRTLERQKELFAKGKSQTMKSRHLTGHAVDLAAMVDGVISWDMKYYKQLAEAMKQAATDEGVPIEWGGNWSSFKDGPHFQLPWGSYP